MVLECAFDQWDFQLFAWIDTALKDFLVDLVTRSVSRLVLSA